MPSGTRPHSDPMGRLSRPISRSPEADMTLTADLGKPITLPTGPRLRPRSQGFAVSPAALLPFVLPLTIVLLWQAAASFGWITNRLMPAPIQVVWAFWDKLSSGQLAVDIQASAVRAISGLL